METHALEKAEEQGLKQGQPASVEATAKPLLEMGGELQRVQQATQLSMGRT